MTVLSLFGMGRPDVSWGRGGRFTEEEEWLGPLFPLWVYREQHARTRTGKTALPAMVLHLCRPGTLVVGRESAWALFRCGVLISFDHANGV